jgi:hypothetical protein
MMAISVVMIVAVATAAFAAVWAISRRLTTVRSCYVLAGILWIAALLSMLLIDTNVPLYSSHYRPGGEAAPAWLATLAFFVRSAAFAAIVMAASRHRNAEHPGKRVSNGR